MMIRTLESVAPSLAFCAPIGSLEAIVRSLGACCSSLQERVVYGLRDGRKKRQWCMETYNILRTVTNDNLADVRGDSRLFDIYATTGTLALEMRVFRTADNFSFLTTIS